MIWGVAFAVLLAALLWVCLALRVQHQALQDLLSAVRGRRACICRKGSAFLRSRQWTQICSEINRLTDAWRRNEAGRAGQLGQLQATLRSMQEAVLIINAGSEIVLANEACRRIFPQAARIEGRRIESVLQSAPFLEYVQAVIKGAGGRLGDIEFPGVEGPVWAEVAGAPIPQTDPSEPRLYLFVLHDVTNLKRLESVRKEFVANVSHELRTPLTMIKGYVETLTDEEQRVSESDRNRFLKIIRKHTDRLNLLLDDLLTLSRLEGGDPHLHREVVLLEKIVPGVVEDFEDALQSHGHTLVLNLNPAPVPVSVDVAKISQVFQNLIANAIKYSSDASSIEVGTEAEGGQVRAWVKDNGVGIHAEDLPHVFERFYRVDKGRSREKGGTGLGLSIVKHIVQLHGGQVGAESRVGDGTTFFFTVPAAISDEA